MVSGVTYPNTLRTLYGSQGQMSLQLVAEMHISPFNGDTVQEKKGRSPVELLSIHQTALSSLMRDYQTPPQPPHPHPQHSPPIPLSLSCLQPRSFQRLKNSPGFMLVDVKGGQKPGLRVCVCVCDHVE